VTDNVYCLVKIIDRNERIIAAVQFEIKLFVFFLYQSKQLTDYYFYGHTVNYRNALERLRVRMNIILLRQLSSVQNNVVSSTNRVTYAMCIRFNDVVLLNHPHVFERK